MRLPLPAFRSEPATHIVSLGMRCEVAYNLRRFYDFSTAYPFDWWITPAGALAAFLAKPDAQNLYDPAELELMESGNSVIHRNGIRLFHEFARDRTQPNKPVAEGWADAIDAPRARTVALTERFLGLNAPGHRIAFVRQPGMRARVISEGLDALFPLAEWTLIPLDLIPRGEDDDWHGDPQAWDRALTELNLSFDRSRHRPFTVARNPNEDRRAGSVGAD